MLGPRQQPFLPRAILTNAVRPGEHHTASRREAGVAGIFDHTGALVAEHQRRLGPRVSTRQDRVIERRDAGGCDANQHPVPCRLRLGQFDLPQPAIARESLRLDRTHRYLLCDGGAWRHERKSCPRPPRPRWLAPFNGARHKEARRRNRPSRSAADLGKRPLGSRCRFSRRRKPHGSPWRA